MRPEDVQLAPTVQRLAHTSGLDLGDVRHARATGQPLRHFDRDGETFWQFSGSTPDGQRLLLQCSPLDVVVWLARA